MYMLTPNTKVQLQKVNNLSNKTKQKATLKVKYNLYSTTFTFQVGNTFIKILQIPRDITQQEYVERTDAIFFFLQNVLNK